MKEGGSYAAANDESVYVAAHLVRRSDERMGARAYAISLALF